MGQQLVVMSGMSVWYDEAEIKHLERAGKDGILARVLKRNKINIKRFVLRN